jgi:membrane fusion protein, copper/silver efflux system
MKRNEFVAGLAILLLLAAGAYGAYWIGMDRGMKMASPAPAAATQTAGEKSEGRKVLYWHDPMVPGQKFDKPGKSPFMDMMLVPVYAGDARDEGSVAISSRVEQNLGIRTAEVTKGPLAAAIEVIGSIAYNERELAVVQARANGFLERLHARAPLDRVAKGSPLAELLVPDWVAAQEEFLAVTRMSDAGIGGVRDGARQRMRLAGMSEEQIKLVESTGKVHPRMTLVAPISGVISELSAREGMTVMAGAALFRINGIDTVWVNAEIPESLAAMVKPGSAIEAHAPSSPGTLFKGKVGAILPEVNAATRTLKARIELGNPRGELVPGMFVTVNLLPQSRVEVLQVPTEAIIQTGKRTVVVLAEMAEDGKQRFRPADVEIGVEANGMTEIRKGLEAGQKVVVSGQFLIDSEANLRATTTRLSEAPPTAGSAHAGDGKVEKIGTDSVTISHGPIPSMQWGAMTMDFKLPKEGIPRDIAEGSTVHFEFSAGAKGDFEITAIKRAAQPATKGAGAK